MEQRSDANEPGIIVGDRVVPAHRLQNPVGHPRGTQRVLEPRVDSGRKNQVRRPQLLDPTQSLELRRVHELDLERFHLDVAVDRIPD